MRLLVLIPVKRNLHRDLQLRCFQNVCRLQAYFQGHVDIYLDTRGPGDNMIFDFKSMDRIENLCEVRQGMVNDYLRADHTHVLIQDADVECDPKIVTGLLRTSQTDIVAPAILGEGELSNQWYDTWAFVEEDGTYVRHEVPYFTNRHVVVSLACVGTVYIVPAEVFREGAKYIPVESLPDHYSVCNFARKSGRKVLCNTGLIVRHPKLSDYGEHRI